MRISSAVVCGPGKILEKNQDNFYLDGMYRTDPTDTSVQHFQSDIYGGAVYAVADGMGGEKHGEIASLIAVGSAWKIDVRRGRDELMQYLSDRNDELCQFITDNGGVRSGSTFVGLCICGETADVINIGDSRAYLLRDGCLSQLSQDHTAIRQMIELGVVSPEAARRHPDRHRLTQYLGIFPDEMIIEPHAVTMDVLPGDVFMLCSDGLYDMVEDTRLQNSLAALESLPEKADELFSAAMDAGGKDNITVLLICVEAEEETLHERAI